LTAIAFAIAIVLAGSMRSSGANPPVLFTGLLVALNIAAVVCQHAVTGALAPTGRRAIYLFPFVFGFLAVGVMMIRGTRQARAVGTLLSAVLVLHFAWTLSLKSCREWYYDAYYPELFSTLFPTGSHSDGVRLNSSWIFNPALRYYQMTVPLPISGLAYQKVLEIDPTIQYYFVERRDSLAMQKNGFALEKKIGPFFLYKNQAR